MQTFLVTALIFGLAMTAMAVGVIFSDRRLKGSCGGTGRDCSCSEEVRKDCALAGAHGHEHDHNHAHAHDSHPHGRGDRS